MLTGKLFEASALLLSFLVVIAGYLVIVWKDSSWINWASPFFLLSVGSKYVFQFLYLYSINPGGSRYAYAFCYTTYGLSFLIGALVYAFVRPIKIRQSGPPVDLGTLPWFLLLLGFLLYLPVLIEFRAYLTEPRRIYELTRTGYGLYYFGSTTFTTLGFVTFLFKRDKGIWSTTLFFTICTALAYWHGSKGQIITYILIWLLYRVYVNRTPIRAFMASVLLASVAGLAIGSFVLFSSAADVADLANSVTTFADYVRNAMLVIDDPHGQIYYGRLLIENEVYSRIPRSIMPDKPKDFGPFILAKIYNPASYRNDEGVGAFDLGALYADFGVLSMFFVCAYSALSALFISSLTLHLRGGAGPGTFIVFLFMVGVSVIPIAGPFYLPESIALAGVVSLAARFRILRPSLTPAEN